MKITYISHACLLIDTGTSRITTDPWFDGPAFCGQWNVFPKPVDAEATEAATVVLISHPHEDHLHEPTLRRLCGVPKKVFYPFYWYPETIRWLRSLELGEVIEARSKRAYRIDDHTQVTFVGAPGQNSIIVIESGGEVLVNVNDALHSEPRSIIDAYVAQIKRRWRKIDVVFCGFGGASYFPNSLHAEDKDDRAVARLREHLFVHNFCRIVQGLEPRTAIPFAADFVLLAEHQRWINEVRFPREAIPGYFAKYFGQGIATTIHAMYPGDRLVDGVFQNTSPYRAQLKNGRLDELIDIQYPEKISAFSSRNLANDELFNLWALRLAAHLDSQIKYHLRSALERVRFALRFSDLPVDSWLNVRWAGSQFEVRQAAEAANDCVARIETTTVVLETSVENDWGGDALTIGYGCDVHVIDQRSSSLARLCVSLLTRYPHPTSIALRNPIRMLDYLGQSAPMIATRLASKIRSRLFGIKDDDVITNPNWLSGNAEAIQRVCRLPEYLEDW